MDPQEAQQQALRIFSTLAPLIGLFMILAIALYIVPLWQICKKAGLSAPLSLLAIIPGVGKLIVLYIIAFSDWRVVPAPYVGLQPYPPPPPNYPPPPPSGYAPPPPASPPQF
jgi:hypothetical protein